VRSFCGQTPVEELTPATDVPIYDGDTSELPCASAVRIAKRSRRLIGVEKRIFLR